ncbi:hypothetical protein EUGRSUZ_K01642 [Eucalyptus grandis]|uniref:Uncharacterized protein n=2 Tax=Eucalyptus grandis TaxID=71139 RepID=A0ACC3IUF8_EUCGR|nr:hypothetical protein EUGRSUZ_K01642 [Eucalyptus grandis]
MKGEKFAVETRGVIGQSYSFPIQGPSCSWPSWRYHSWCCRCSCRPSRHPQRCCSSCPSSSCRSSFSSPSRPTACPTSSLPPSDFDSRDRNHPVLLWMNGTEDRECEIRCAGRRGWRRKNVRKTCLKDWKIVRPGWTGYRDSTVLLHCLASDYLFSDCNVFQVPETQSW